MKKTTSLLALSLSYATPAIATGLFAGGAFPAEILLSTYTIAGLFYITATDYSPRRIFASTEKARMPNASWIRRSVGRSRRLFRAFRAEKTMRDPTAKLTPLPASPDFN
jgi:hypothetical protein